MKCWLKCWSKCCLTIWWSFRQNCIQRWYVKCIDGFSNFCQKIASDFETIKCIDKFSILSKNCILMIECIDGFSILSKGCIWFWNNQMHWRIFDLSENCIWRWNDQMHWRIFDLFRCFDYRCSGEVFDCVISLFQLQM